MANGANWLAGGIAAAVGIPLLAFGAGLPFLVAVVSAGLAGTAVAVLTAPRTPFARLDGSGADSGKVAFARELLVGAEPCIGRLEASASAIRSAATADEVRRMAQTTRQVFAGIEADPGRLDKVRRFLTFYLPKAADLAETYATLENGQLPDPARLTSASELLGRLDKAFLGYAARATGADTDRLDIELKLLRSSLDEDLGPTPPSDNATAHKEKT